jgi:hypothetical protein
MAVPFPEMLISSYGKMLCHIPEAYKPIVLNTQIFKTLDATSKF